MKIVGFICLLLVLTGKLCGQGTPDYLTEINTLEDFVRMKGKPLSTKYGDIKSLKLVYHRRSKKLHYIESTRYPYHLDFCEQVLDYYKGSFNFNYENYTQTQGRDYYLANINLYPADSIYVLEFSITDQIKIEQIEELYDKVKSTFHIADSIYLFLNTSALEKRFSESNSDIPTVDASDLYSGQLIQTIQPGKVYGKLKILDKLSADDFIEPNTIVILNGNANDIPIVDGLICSNFQTPLSHISLLCQNRLTPFVADRKIMENTAYLDLEDKLVCLEVNEYNYKLYLANKDSAEAYVEQVNVIEKIHELSYDTSFQTLLKIEDVDYSSLSYVGAKAANFGEINKVLKKKSRYSKVPENGAAIPFYFYLEHIKKSGADTLIEQLLSSSDMLLERELLDSIRTVIKRYPVDADLIQQVDAHMKADARYRRYRYRSSTNAEDIEGFNGAGLYDSKSAELDNPDKSVGEAIAKVWASAWNNRAFYERRIFGIDHKNLAMGILIHRSFPDEEANGVVITHNIYRPENLGFVINVQKGDVPVVNPEAGVICDQLICYSDTDNTFYTPKKIVEYISKSSINNGEAVLEDAQIIRITKEIATLKKHYYRKINRNWLKYDFQRFALDLEFKVDEGQIYIKQIRPFR